MKRLAVIDGKSLFYRGYYAMPNLSLPDGTPTGGVYGFASIAIELIKKLEPDYVAVAWDKPKTNIRKRREIYPEYKAGRKPAPADFYAQIPILMELLDAFGWPFYELDDYEADDILGAFAKQATEKGIETCLLTSDLDSLQLIGPLTKVYAIKNGLSNIEEFDVAAFEAKYGIEVEQFLDLKSLKGDSSDNLPGVPGVGEKTAIQLLQEFKTLDNIYDNLDNIKPSVANKLLAGKSLAYMSKEVGRIWVDAPVELDWGVADIADINLQKVADILDRLEFHSLVRRLPDHMKLPNGDVQTVHASDISTLKHGDWPDTLSIDGPVLVHIDEQDLWITTNQKTVYSKNIKEIDHSTWVALEMTELVAYDVKDLCHKLAESNIFPKFQTIHDIRQAAFLINPLGRDRSLEALTRNAETPVGILSELCNIYQQQKQAFIDNERIANIAREFDFPVIRTLFEMEHHGVLLQPEYLANMSREISQKYADLEQEIYSMLGYEFNIGSPAQLSEALFTKLQLPTAGVKRGKTGYSTGQSELDKLRGQHPIIELIEQSRELAKLKNTYTDSLPKLVDSHNYLHTTFNQDVAATGRLSSTNPNLQNIPIRSEIGRKIREAFVPAKGNKFVSADYSQFELRLAAVLAGDKNLIDDFNSDIDVHTKTASEVYGIPIDEVTKNQRRDAKVINFGILYGMSPHGLSAATGMTWVEAKKFIDQYFELRQPIQQYINDTLDKARKDGYVETYYGRRRPTPDIHSSNFMVRQAAERAAANMPIQGTEADLMKRAMVKVDQELVGIEGAHQVLQIHDSILVECPEKDADRVADIMKNVMEGVAPELEINLKVDVSIGSNWGEL